MGNTILEMAEKLKTNAKNKSDKQKVREKKNVYKLITNRLGEPTEAKIMIEKMLLEVTFWSKLMGTYRKEYSKSLLGLLLIVKLLN